MPHALRPATSPIASLFALLAIFSGGWPGAAARGGDGVTPAGDPVLEPATLHSLGVHWVVRGDDNRNARVEVRYRKAGAGGDAGGAWRPGPALFRVEKGANKNQKGQSSVEVPADAWLFAGSVLLLEEDSEYELKLTLRDPDGGGAEKLLRARTIAEPAVAPDAPVRHVVPAGEKAGGGGSGGDGGRGADGSAARPFRGLAAAQKAARPGDVFLLHAGLYQGPFYVERSGEPGRPIVWRGAGDGEAAIDNRLPREALKGAAIEAINVHDVWFERLSAGHAYNAIRAHGSARLVIRRCHLHDCICGIFALNNDKGVASNYFICDNLIEGFMPWPTTAKQWEELPESRGLWLGGVGHDFCFNRVRHMKDGMDTADQVPCYAIDFHNNDVSEMFDDGCEMDGSERNTRNFHNRYANTLCGVSLQPVYGGPVYVFRNVAYNFQTEAFKLHNKPSGGVLFHNTMARNGGPLFLVNTSEPIQNCFTRNNLFVGTGGRALNFESPASGCDFDYDGFAGWGGEVFLKWNGERYRTPQEARAKSPVEKHALVLDPANLFVNATAPADGAKVYDLSAMDLRLKPGSPALGAGEVLPGLNDGFTGKAPDLGAYESGAAMPHYGPREERKKG